MVKVRFAWPWLGRCQKFYGGRLEGMVFVDGKATTQLSIPELANHVGVVLADYDTQLVTMTVREEVAFAMETVVIIEQPLMLVVLRCLNKLVLKALRIVKLRVCQAVNVNVWRLLLCWQPIHLSSFLMNQRALLTPMGQPNYIASLVILNRNHGITVVVIDHDLHAVLPYANRMALMVDGEIVCDSDVATTFGIYV